MKLEKIKSLIENGECKVFNNWNEVAQISEAEFLKGYQWLLDDPLTENECMTRELGLQTTSDGRKKYMIDHNPDEAETIYGKGNLSYDQNKIKGRVVKLTRSIDKFDQVSYYDQETGYIWVYGVSISSRDRL